MELKNDLTNKKKKVCIEKLNEVNRWGCEDLRVTFGSSLTQEQSVVGFKQKYISVMHMK